MTKVQKQIVNVNRGEGANADDWLASEWPLTLVVNGSQYITLLTTPDHLEDLAVGFALGDGLLESKADIINLTLSADGKQVEIELGGNPDLAARLAATRVLTTGCGKGSRYYRAVDSLRQKPVQGGRTLTADTLTGLMREFNQSSPLFAQTGAVHAAALATETLVALREDVARHNAVDKLAGHLILNEQDGSDFALLTSGRISSELVLKAARIGVGMIVSRSAPTDLAVDLAESLGLTLAGFARGQRFNIYSHFWRVEGLK